MTDRSTPPLPPSSSSSEAGRPPRRRRPLGAVVAATAAAACLALGAALPGADAALLRAGGARRAAASDAEADAAGAGPIEAAAAQPSSVRAARFLGKGKGKGKGNCKKGKDCKGDDAGKQGDDLDVDAPILIDDTGYAEPTADATPGTFTPVEIDGVQQCVSPAPEGTKDFLLYETFEECCNFYDICPVATGDPVDSGPMEGPSGLPQPEYWVPGVLPDGATKRCIFGTEYDPEYLDYPDDIRADLLFESLALCCVNHPEACHYWYPAEVDGGERMCLHGNEYDPSYLNTGNMLYDTHDECCATYDVCAPAAPDKAVKWWPETTDEGVICTHSDGYDDSWIGVPGVLFDDFDSCCDYYGVCPEGAPEGPPDDRPPHWWPVYDDDAGAHSHCEYNDLYPEAYEHEAALVFFETEHACCSEYELCPEYWYPKDQGDGTLRCEFDAEYPDAMMDPSHRESFLFVDKMYCCMTYPTGCPYMLWHPNEAYADCVYGDDYPDDFVDDGKVFVDRQLCLDALPTMVHPNSVPPPDEGGNGGVDPNSVPPPEEGPALCDAPDCTWHESQYAGDTCTNSGDYPPAWDSPEAYNYTRAHFFFTTAEECCATRFPDGCNVDFVDPDEAGDDGDDGHGEVDDAGYVTCAPGKSLVEDFEGGAILPFDLGEHWEYSTERAASGSKALASVPREGESATSDLALKVRLRTPAQVRCQVKVDASMPFELFYLEVDGGQRNTYAQRFADFMNVETGLGAGDHTLVFRVRNTDDDSGNPPTRDEEFFGVGRVWIDDCEVVANPF